GTPACLSPEARAALQRYPFPGNVRELENVLERALALATADELQPLDLMLPQPEIDLLLEPAGPELDAAGDGFGVEAGAQPAAGSAEATAAGSAAVEEPAVAKPSTTFTVVDGVPSDLQAYLDEIEREAIRAAVARTRNNRTAAAQLLGLTFRQLRYRMQRLGLR
ncbi:MAG: helix-turn-helix domain-containing protein, partial [Betaproteobacteria bacterium]